MEGFCLDVQRLILEKVSQVGKLTGSHHVSRLRHLFCVNRMFRRWVSRYVVDTLNEKWFTALVSRKVGPIPIGWDVQTVLETQWSKKSPTLFSAFIMYLDATEYPTRRNEKAANLLFFSKASILKDLKRRKRQMDIFDVQERQIEREKEFIERFTNSLETHKERLENSLKRREAADEVIDEIDKKYAPEAHKKVKKG